MDIQETKLVFCEKVRFAAIAILILTIFELFFGKLLNRIMIAPELGIVLIVAGLTFAGVACLGIRELKKVK